MQRFTITSTCYHTRLAWFGAICNALPDVTVKFIKNIYINIFLKKITVMLGNSLKIAQNQANIGEDIR